MLTGDCFGSLVMTEGSIMLLFTVSIFLSAFLLFQIQPVIGKFILPWFGGTPAVWTTVILFFQVALTGGYAYAYWLTRRFEPKRQVTIHLSLIGLTVLLLVVLSHLWPSPITPRSTWKPDTIALPVLHVFKLLAISIGLPYFILASNSPLMQAWFSRLFPGIAYARLYAVSNTGSLLGLLTYPILIEPALSLRWQGWLWAAGFSLFGFLAGLIGARAVRAAPPAQPLADPVSSTAGPSFALRSLWILLSATGSIFLLSVTNQISQEVAVIPFLWILPLTLYLLTFILTFTGSRGYRPRFYSIFFIVSLALTLFVMLNATALHVVWHILSYCLLLFSACMCCHGELYRLRPSAGQLTAFYLMISIGGALGGIFVSLIAPLLFNGYWEFFVGLAMTLPLIFPSLRAARAERRAEPAVEAAVITKHPVRKQSPTAPGDDTARCARFVFTVFVLTTIMLAVLSTLFSGALFSRRNFYGIIRVHELIPQGSTEPAYVMSHGITVHGLQFIAPDLRDLPTTYYVEEAARGLPSSTIHVMGKR